MVIIKIVTVSTYILIPKQLRPQFGRTKFNHQRKVVAPINRPVSCAMVFHKMCQRRGIGSYLEQGLKVGYAGGTDLMTAIISNLQMHLLRSGTSSIHLGGFPGPVYAMMSSDRLDSVSQLVVSSKNGRRNSVSSVTVVP